MSRSTFPNNIVSQLGNATDQDYVAVEEIASTFCEAASIRNLIVESEEIEDLMWLMALCYRAGFNAKRRPTLKVINGGKATVIPFPGVAE